MAKLLMRINYMKYARLWLSLSVILIILSLFALFRFDGGRFDPFGGLNKGIDFTGGISYDLQFEQRVTSQQVETIVTKISSGAQVQNAEVKDPEAGPEATSYFVKVPKELTNADRKRLLTDLEQLGAYKKIGEDEVSGTVSGELAMRATLAILIAALLQIIYIWIRFQFKFGITAVLALLHDCIITLGLMALFQVQVNSAFVAAILTVLGYSMNDTVVVIDRIRENIGKRKKGESWEQLTTRSIQEVITRSLYTGVSVQMMLISMLVWGGDSVWDFAMTLLIGVTAGTYSSIFIASALWLLWKESDERRKKAMSGIKPAKA